jgi:hypothetical protein
MSFGPKTQHMHHDTLRAKYRGAFEEWVSEVNHLQEVAGAQPGTCVAQEAEQRAASAEKVYRKNRDRLTDHMELASVKTKTSE